MAVTYHVLLGKTHDWEVVSVPVTKKIFQGYGIDLKEFHETAMKNTIRLFPPELHSMWDLIYGNTQSDGIEGKEPGAGMYVLTNSRNMHGAISILDPETMNKAAECVGGEFYMLPSSIHEVIILKKEEGMNYHALEAMVQEINDTQVSDGEILSDHVYESDMKEHCLVRCDCAAERKQQQETIKNRREKIKKEHQVRGPKL